MQLGTNLEIATLDQKRESLDPEASVATILTGGSGDQVIIDGEPRHVIGYMKDFLFKPEQARTPVKALSGGERGRLLLARALAQPSNLMVLDEPTNDLDLETLDLLQEMLAAYPGTLILVSHDRDFLDRTVTSVIAFEGEGKWIEYAGGYSDMVAQRGAGVGALAARASRQRRKRRGQAGARRARLRAAQAPQPHRATCLEDRARPHRGSSRGDPPAGASARRSRASMPATVRALPRREPSSPSSSQSSLRRRKNGSGSNCCARKCKGPSCGRAVE